MVNELQERVENEIAKIIKKASEVEIVSNVPFNQTQMALLRELNYFATTQTLYDEEVLRDPRKILYKTNQNFKTSLVSLCLTQVLINKRSKGYYTKEYFEHNIDVKTIDSGVKRVDFNHCEDSEVLAAINEEKVFDWILYCQGRGIEAFVAEKTNCRGLEGFVPGYSPEYEFSRFERLHDEAKKRKQAEEKEKLQQEFKTSFMKELAVGLAKQQIENSSNVIDLVSSLFEKENYNDAISKLLNNSLENDNKQDDIKDNFLDEKLLSREKSQKMIANYSNDLPDGFIQYVKAQKQKQR